MIRDGMPQLVGTVYMFLVLFLEAHDTGWYTTARWYSLYVPGVIFGST